MKELTNWSRIGLARWSVACALVMLVLIATASLAQDAVIYNSIPHPLPSNVASEGPEAYAFSQLGDALALAGPGGRKLDKVTVVMSSWACTSGHWYTAGSCVTTPGATFTLPITLNIYSVVTGVSLEGFSPSVAAGSLLASVTQNFAIPYRPSANTVNCANGQWYNSETKTCSNGLATPITFDLSSLHLTLPSQVIVGVQYNTSDYGPNPIGTAPCQSSSGGCLYDSLNISTDSNGGIFRAIGTVLNVDGIFVNYTLPGNSCSGSATTLVFGLDASPGCWTDYHPEIRITAKKNSDEHEHRHGDMHDGRSADSD